MKRESLEDLNVSVFRISQTIMILLLGIFASVQVGLAQDTSGITAEALKGRPYSPYADRAFPTDVFFGDTHVHTAISADAAGGGTTLGPRDAYRFARGEQVISNTGQPVKLSRPLDFYMITDHSDGMGAIKDIIAGTPNILADPVGKQFHEAFSKGGQEAADAAFRLTGLFGQGKVPETMNYQPGNPAFKRVWDDIVQATEEFNQPYRFTTFIAFEWTSLVKGNNLHRNVIFRDGPERAGSILPYTTTPPLGSPDPRDLWKYLENYEKTTGGSVIAIPHNGNLSNGMMFALQDDFQNGKPLDRQYAEQRQKWERLYEAAQMKGDGEAHPLLSPTDEFADFETWDMGNLDLSEKKTPQMLPGEYARSGLKRGLEMEAKLGVNPFKFGLVGASDNHVGLTTPDNDNFFGKFKQYEPNPHRANHLSKENKENGAKLYSWQYITSGLTAVWAESNTRAAIFDAMKRRETYATTGTRIRLRFFGGFDFAKNDALHRDLALIGYTKGVPMGSDLKKAPAGKSATFLVYALRDPMGANLDRIQIIKGWLDANGNSQEKVYDVAWSGDRTPDANGKLPPVGDTVDLSIPTWTNTIGSSELGTVWMDPDFDSKLRAFYYARVIEIPTPRWTAYDRVKFNLDLPKEIPLKNQERAYSSPIWYTP
ncbi:DUF3604 domain-containing protein [bacterium]|nr:DUF3604 domain-containing protein [bacterium]MCI0616467.1 DUF3604 domain-containing protein [bacterium]